MILVAVGSLSLILSVRDTALQPTSAYFSTLDRAWELIAGALLAISLPLLGRLPEICRSVLTWIGIAGMATAAVVYSAATPFPGSAALLPVLAACAVLVGGIGSPRRQAHHLLGRRPMRFVGDISYSLYLWHWPLLILAAAYAGHELGAPQAVLVVCLAVLLSSVSYRWVENPLRHSRRRWGAKPYGPLLLWPVTVGAVVLLAVVGQSTGPTVVSTPSVYTAGSADQTSAAASATVGSDGARPRRSAGIGDGRGGVLPDPSGPATAPRRDPAGPHRHIPRRGLQRLFRLAFLQVPDVLALLRVLGGDPGPASIVRLLGRTTIGTAGPGRPRPGVARRGRPSGRAGCGVSVVRTPRTRRT